MNKNRITLLSMLVISSVFCISFIFSIQLPLKAITARTLEDDGKITAEARITEETSEEAITSLFSYNIDTTDSYNDENSLSDSDYENQSDDAGQKLTPIKALGTASTALNDETTTEQTQVASDSDVYDEYEEKLYKAAYKYMAETEKEEAANNNSEKVKEEAPKAKYSNIGISIAKEYVNIRKKPTTDSESLGKLYRDSACTIIEEKDGWYYVESGNVKGYTKAELIKTGIPDEEIIQKYGTKKIRVTVDGLNVRKEPSTDSKKITVIYMNEKYPIVEKVDDWYKIKLEDEGLEGYIKCEFSELIVAFKEAVSKEEEARLLELKAEERAKKETAVKYRADYSYTNEDLKLLACLIHAEAGTQSYEGKLAVANVVINRVKSSKYPDTIKSVIYQKGQFSVAASGSLQKQLDNYANYKSSSQRMSVKAAKDALEGANNIGSRLYFHTYKAAAKKGYHDNQKSVKIDDHLFW
jgi:uncharacterized protein YgiM (DUF1202 family)